MKLLKYVGIGIFFFSLGGQVFALDTRVSQAYQSFENTIEQKYTLEKQAAILQSLQQRLLNYSYQKHNSAKAQLIEDMIQLNHEAIFQRWRDTELSHSPQISKEATIRETLLSQTSQVILSQNYRTLEKAGERDFIATNPEGEFVKDDAIYKVQYTDFYSFASNSLEALQKKRGIIIQVNPGEYRFIENYSFEKKIPYSQMQDSLAGFFTNEYRVLEKSGWYYGYLFQNSRSYADEYGAYQSQLDTSGFTKQGTFLYRDTAGKYHFVTEYTERKLVSVQDMFGVSQKELFLKYLLSDAKHLASDISKNMQAIATVTRGLPRTNTQQETIAQIYAWILENLEYSNILNLEDTQIFSAGEAFQTKDGVCTAYSKLMVYMLLYKNISDIEMIEGHVIDAPDFPKIGHAWVRVGDTYYDPTFDDPIGASSTKIPAEYRYYKLPQDIFYANRFSHDALPEMFKTASKTQISQYIFNILSNLLTTYGTEAQNYHVFAPVLFRNTYKIPANTPLTPELLASKIGSYEVAKDTFRYTKDGKEVLISGLKYYTLTPENTQGILENLNYNITDMPLFDWELSDGTREWRLAYELTTR